MIENLLKESDFLDPTNLDPCEYMPITPKTAITDLSSSSNGGGDANGGSSPNNSPTPFQVSILLTNNLEFNDFLFAEAQR